MEHCALTAAPRAQTEYGLRSELAAKSAIPLCVQAAIPRRVFGVAIGDSVSTEPSRLRARDERPLFRHPPSVRLPPLRWRCFPPIVRSAHLPPIPGLCRRPDRDGHTTCMMCVSSLASPNTRPVLTHNERPHALRSRIAAPQWERGRLWLPRGRTGLYAKRCMRRDALLPIIGGCMARNMRREASRHT